MLYEVYTDGANGTVEDKISGASYLILCDDNYVTASSKKLIEIANPTYAETIAVGLASRYLLENKKLTPKDTVRFNIDCKSTVEFCNKYILQDKSSTIPSRVKAVIASVTIIRKLSEICPVQFRRIKGHKDFLNPNTFVDRLAKLAIRR